MKLGRRLFCGLLASAGLSVSIPKLAQAVEPLEKSERGIALLRSSTYHPQRNACHTFGTSADTYYPMVVMFHAGSLGWATSGLVGLDSAGYVVRKWPPNSQRSGWFTEELRDLNQARESCLVRDRDPKAFSDFIARTARPLVGDHDRPLFILTCCLDEPEACEAAVEVASLAQAARNPVFAFVSEGRWDPSRQNLKRATMEQLEKSARALSVISLPEVERLMGPSDPDEVEEMNQIEYLADISTFFGGLMYRPWAGGSIDLGYMTLAMQASREIVYEEIRIPHYAVKGIDPAHSIVTAVLERCPGVLRALAAVVTLRAPHRLANHFTLERVMEYFPHQGCVTRAVAESNHWEIRCNILAAGPGAR